jgi:serine/threonine protein kinase
VESLNDLVLYLSDETLARNKATESSVQFTSVIKFNELYQLEQILGAGGFGVVCQVTCKQTGRHLALKITQLNPKSPSNAALALELES